MTDLPSLFGQIDIYLFDQILRGRIAPGMTVLDAGCGSGRNLVFFLREGYEVYGLDPDANSVRAVQRLLRELAPRLPAANIREEPVESNGFPDAIADAVISSAVLHFARDEGQFEAMLRGTWRLVKRGGLMFCRLASTIGMEDRFRPIGGRRFGLPDGSERYLVDERYLLDWTVDLGGRLLDPLKTTVVSGQRCMTTWVAEKA